jgi:hypothetical protein
MRREGIVAGLLTLAVSGTFVASASASGQASRVHRCPSFDVGSLHVAGISTNSHCATARKTIRRLLRHGVNGLPARKATRRKWGCRNRGSKHVCKKLGRTRSGTVSVSFTAQPVDPRAAPADCIGLWNADAAFIARYALHFYLDHGVRRGWALHWADGQRQVCVVVFVDPDPSDVEYGTLGGVNRPAVGWVLMGGPMDNLIGDPIGTQIKAPANANVSLDASGKIAPL